MCTDLVIHVIISFLFKACIKKDIFIGLYFFSTSGFKLDDTLKAYSYRRGR